MESSSKLYSKSVDKFALLTKEEESELAQKVKAGDKRAREKLINHNLRLVLGIARRYMNKGLSLEDLIQEGNIGLIKAVDKIDPEKEARFATYASFWIRQSILLAIANQARIVRIPANVVDDIRKLNTTLFLLFKELGREPTNEEIAEKTTFSAKKIQELKGIAQDNIVSIDAEAGREAA